MKRKFNEDGIMHIYQRTISGYNVFYCLEDFIIFYTIVSVYAKKFGIKLLAMCLMIDHTHLLASCSSLETLSRFISAYTSMFVREFNLYTGRSGPLFKKAYGSAVKMEWKKIRSAIAYLFNNPVEKQLCTKAEDYTWNFLRLFCPEYTPVSTTIKRSRKLKRSMKMVKDNFNKGYYLKYTLLDYLYKDLSKHEKRILTQYILEVYFPFDTEKVCNYYKSYEDMVIAINSNTGSEYEIKENHYGKTDVPYREIMSCLNNMNIADCRSVLTMDTEMKVQLTGILKQKTSASSTQIRKFLQIPIKKKTKVPKEPK